MKLAASGQSADRARGLNYKHAPTAPRQIGGADQAVVPSPNYDCVVMLHPRKPLRLPTNQLATLASTRPRGFHAYTQHLMGFYGDASFDGDASDTHP